MAKLLYVMNVTLDGYIADEDGKLDWAAPDEEFFSFINDLVRPVGTYLYGRRLYELMAVWETDPAAAAQSPGAREFAEIWQAADKVVYSRTLATASTTRTRIERDFDPEAVHTLLISGRLPWEGPVLVSDRPDMEGRSFKLEASYCRPDVRLSAWRGRVRLAAVGAEPVAWAERDVLTIAVRQSGKAPSVVGTVSGSNARLTPLPANGLKELLNERARQCGRPRVSQ